MKMRLENACWLGEDGAFHRGTLTLADGRIASMEECRSFANPPRPSAPQNLQWTDLTRTLDASGGFFVPGLIDPHVHLREPGQAWKEGIANGTAAALKGGVTSLLDMPNNVPPVTTLKRFESKCMRFAEKSHVNWGLFMQATAAGEPAPKTAAGIKIYMAKSSALPALRSLRDLERIFRREKRVIIHAEDEAEFSTVWKKSFHSMEKSVHHRRRPKAAIRSALKRIETVLERIPAAGRPVVIIAHCSSAEELKWVARMKHRGFKVHAETCPHYALLTEKDYIRRGSVLQVNPPLRGEADRATVREAIRDGLIDFISTDHAPHLPKEKADAESPPSGIAGIEWLGPILLTWAMRGEISWTRYLDLSGRNAAACYRLKDRGEIRPGAFADLVWVQMGGKAGPGSVATRATVHPYEDFPFAVRIRAVAVNGLPAWLDGQVNPEGRGMDLYGC